MKKIGFIFALLATTLVAWAQETDETVIELMNGSIIRGQLVDVGDGQRLYIETGNGSVIYFTRKAVKEIDSQKILPTVRNFRNPVTVYLRNGSIITGQLTELQEGGEMKIETPNRSIVYFTERTLKEVVSGEASARQPRVTADRPTPSPQRRTAPGGQTAETQTLLPPDELPPYSGYRGSFEAGYTVKMGDLSANRFEVSTSHGYQIDPSLFAGIGFGANFYGDGFFKNDVYHDSIGGPTDVINKTVDSLNMSVVIPIFADVRYSFMTESSVIPFIGLKAGYSMGLAQTKKQTDQSITKETKLQGVGFFIAPSVGAKYVVSPSLALTFSLAYAMQLYDYSRVEKERNVLLTKKNINGGVSIKVGVEF
ncbi:MAG: hypothetical protein LBJ60_07195 [Tannerellaceae bacterium]|jgi:small nuclear ribonucleoprotein (snRNP)-like protein|nr:hypothetical protein [Tannerellaceae bacterium]